LLRNFAVQYTQLYAQSMFTVSKGLKNWRGITLWNSSFRCN